MSAGCPPLAHGVCCALGETSAPLEAKRLCLVYGDGGWSAHVRADLTATLLPTPHREGGLSCGIETWSMEEPGAPNGSDVSGSAPLSRRHGVLQQRVRPSHRQSARARHRSGAGGLGLGGRERAGAGGLGTGSGGDAAERSQAFIGRSLYGKSRPLAVMQHIPPTVVA